jgi:hypothetical protein
MLTSISRDSAHALEATGAIATKELFDLGDRARNERSVVHERLVLRLARVMHDACAGLTGRDLQCADAHSIRPIEPTYLTHLQRRNAAHARGAVHDIDEPVVSEKLSPHVMQPRGSSS